MRHRFQYIQFAGFLALVQIATASTSHANPQAKSTLFEQVKLQGTMGNVPLTQEQANVAWNAGREKLEAFLTRCKQLGIIHGRETPEINFFGQFRNALGRQQHATPHLTKQLLTSVNTTLAEQDRPTNQEAEYLTFIDSDIWLSHKDALKGQKPLNISSASSFFKVFASRAGAFEPNKEEMLASSMFQAVLKGTGYLYAGAIYIRTKVHFPGEKKPTQIASVQFGYSEAGPTMRNIPDQKKAPYGVATLRVESTPAKGFFGVVNVFKSSPILAKVFSLDIVLPSSRIDNYFAQKAQNH